MTNIVKILNSAADSTNNIADENLLFDTTLNMLSYYKSINCSSLNGCGVRGSDTGEPISILVALSYKDNKTSFYSDGMPDINTQMRSGIIFSTFIGAPYGIKLPSLTAEKKYSGAKKYSEASPELSKKTLLLEYYTETGITLRGILWSAFSRISPDKLESLVTSAKYFYSDKRTKVILNCPLSLYPSVSELENCMGTMSADSFFKLTVTFNTRVDANKMLLFLRGYDGFSKN